MTPHEQTQLYTEVDKAFHEKYPEYGDGPIDPATNPEAAKKWLDERDQILASHNSPLEPTVAEKAPKLPGAEQTSNEKSPGDVERNSNPATNPDAARKLSDARDQALPSRSEPPATDSAIGAVDQPKSPQTAAGFNEDSKTAGPAAPEASDTTPSRANNSSNGSAMPSPSSGEAASIAPQADSPTAVDSAGLKVNPMFVGDHVGISTDVSVDPATGKATGKGSVKVQNGEYGLGVGKSMSDSGQTSAHIELETPVGTIEATYQDSSTATSIGIGLEEKKDFKLSGGRASLAAEANGTIKGNKVIPSENPELEPAFFRSIDMSYDLSLSASAKLPGDIGAGAELKGTVASGSRTWTHGSNRLNIYDERHLYSPDGPMLAIEESKGDKNMLVTRQYLEAKRDAARAQANHLAAQGRSDEAYKYFAEFQHWNHELNKP